MAINLTYNPNPVVAGTVARQAGQGFFDQKQGDRRENRYMLQAQLDGQRQNAMLNAAIQSRQLQQSMQAQQAQQAMDWQRTRMQAELQQNQQLMNFDLAQMEQQGNLAYRDQLGQQQLALQRELGFAELDQQTQIQALRNRPEAQQAWAELQGRRDNIQRALSEGWLTQEQAAQYEQAVTQETLGFNPQRFPYQGQFEPGRDMGDIWTEESPGPDGQPMALRFTRDRNGVPQLTDDSRILYEQAVKAHYEQQGAAMSGGGARNAPKPAVTMGDYASMYARIADSLAGVGPNGETIPADPAEVDRIVGQMTDSYQQRFGVQQPGGGWGGVQAAPIEGNFGGGGPIEGSFGSGPNPRAMQPQGQPQPQPPMTPVMQLRQAMGDLPPDQFAQYVVGSQPNLAINHLFTVYPQGEAQLRAAGDPYDIALLMTLAQMRGR